MFDTPPFLVLEVEMGEHLAVSVLDVEGLLVLDHLPGGRECSGGRRVAWLAATQPGWLRVQVDVHLLTVIIPAAPTLDAGICSPALLRRGVRWVATAFDAMDGTPAGATTDIRPKGVCLPKGATNS